MFRRYVPVEVIEEYIKQSDNTILSGRVGEATILFLDMVEFTTLSEQMVPADVVALLNQYFTLMVDVIEAHQGILDKFIGDGLMAIFGMPRSVGSVEGDAQQAVRAALAIAQGVGELNVVRVGQPPIRLRMGIHSGPVVAGNIGSARRVNYTAVSDTVNTPSRIEDSVRQLIGQEMAYIAISQATYQLVQGRLNGMALFVPLGPVTLRGKAQPVTLYQVKGGPGG